jgi:hypothetical protein
MNSLEELNTFSQTSLTYTDNRIPKIIFDRVTPLAQTTNIPAGLAHTMPVGIEMLDIVNASSLGIYYEINVSATAGATVAWTSLPSGVTYSNPATGIYRITNITTIAQWNAVKNARVTLPNTYGTFNYSATIYYSPSQSKTWTVTANVVIIINIASAFTMATNGGPLVGTPAALTATTSLTATGRFKITHSGEAVMSSLTSMTATGTKVKFGVAPMTSTATVFARVGKKQFASASLSSAVTVDNVLLGIRKKFISTMASTSTMTTAAITLKPLSSTMTSPVTLSLVNPVRFKLLSANATIYDPNTESGAGDAFGTGLAVGTDYIVVGAPYEDYTTAKGKLYVFNTSDNSLAREMLGAVTNARLGQQIGLTFVSSTNYAVTNSYQTGGSLGQAHLYNIDTGSIVYTKTSSSGPLPRVGVNQTYFAFIDQPDSATPYLRIYDIATGTLQRSVNVSKYNFLTGLYPQELLLTNTYAILGSQSDSWTVGAQSGYGSLTAINLSTGSETFYITNPGPVFGTSVDFGNAVAATNDYAAVTAPGVTATNYSNADGAVYLYNLSTGSLVWTAYCPDVGAGADTTSFGNSVAIDGDYVVVGAPYMTPAGGTTNSGRVYIYDLYTGDLVFILNNPNAYSTVNNDNFGYNLAIFNKKLVVSATGEDSAAGSSQGIVYVYNLP